MDGEAGWWTTSGNIGLPPLARVMGVGRQQQHDDVSLGYDHYGVWESVYVVAIHDSQRTVQIQQCGGEFGCLDEYLILTSHTTIS